MKTKYEQGYWAAKRVERDYTWLWFTLGFAFLFIGGFVGDYLWQHGF